jgi:hypothetical protein
MTLCCTFASGPPASSPASQPLSIAANQTHCANCGTERDKAAVATGRHIRQSVGKVSQPSPGMWQFAAVFAALTACRGATKKLAPLFAR